MKTIVVASHDNSTKLFPYRACLETDPNCYGHGASVNAAAGNLVRCNFGDLDLEDSDLQVRLGVHWDDMTDSEIGCLVKERELFAIDVRNGLPTN